MMALLSKDHTILEKGMMEFRPFGVDPEGNKIRDSSGITVRANVEFLHDVVAKAKGEEAGTAAVAELARRLNERIPDKAYHVTPAFLMDIWNSYSYEFVMFLAEFCIILSGDPSFQFHMGETKLISPVIQTLGRPFGVRQIYKMFPHFGQKYSKGSLHFESDAITDHSAVLRMKIKDHIYRQFGPYRYACASHLCQSSKAALGIFPQLIYGLKPATILDRSCMADGDEYCEWEFTWIPKPPRPAWGGIAGAASGIAALTLLSAAYPEQPWHHIAGMSFLVGTSVGFAYTSYLFQRKVADKDRLLQEQVGFVDLRHEELREAYLLQQQAAVDLKRKIGQLTLLHKTGVIVSSTLDREELIDTALRTIKNNLNFDRVMLSFYDPEKRSTGDARLLGVSDEVAAFARTLSTPVGDSSTIEAQLFLEGAPILVRDIRSVWDRLHPLSQQLASVTHTKSIISVPLKVKTRIIGALTVDRLQDNSLNEEDLDIMVTVANELAIALDHASAYHEIETLNASLEMKIRDRTAQLEAANLQLRELNQVKSTFVSVVSHELRTPMTSIRVYVENMLDGLTGVLSEKQIHYLDRILFNIDRLTRMIIDLLDLSKIEAGKTEMRYESVPLNELLEDISEGFRHSLLDKGISLRISHAQKPIWLHADKDKLTQILTNLIGNALKFTPSGGLIELITLQPTDEQLTVSVRDTGCGIPAEELPRIFEKFFRGDSAPSTAKGAGLGLAIVKSFAELHGGSVSAESTPGKGSCFSVTFPLCQPSGR